jgi:hypothetical protein
VGRYLLISREGAAVLAAWSINLEGEQPGALARREPAARPVGGACRFFKALADEISGAPAERECWWDSGSAHAVLPDC